MLMPVCAVNSPLISSSANWNGSPTTSTRIVFPDELDAGAASGVCAATDRAANSPATRKRAASGGVAGLVGGPVGSGAAPRLHPRRRPAAIRRLLGDPFQFALEAIKDQFTAETGINIVYENLAYDQLERAAGDEFRQHTLMPTWSPSIRCATGQYSDSGWMSGRLHQPRRGHGRPGFHPGGPLFAQHLGARMMVSPAHRPRADVYRQSFQARKSIEALSDRCGQRRRLDLGALPGDRREPPSSRSRGRVSSAPSSAGRSRCRMSTCTPNLPPASAPAGSELPNAPWDFTPTINSPENVEALAFYKSLYELSPPERSTTLRFDAGTRFSAEEHRDVLLVDALFLSDNSYMTHTPSGLEEVFGYGVLPKLSDDSEQTTSLGTTRSAFQASSPNQEGPRQFIKWATGAEGAEEDGPVAGSQLPVERLLRVSLYTDPEIAEMLPYPRLWSSCGRAMAR